MCVCVRVCMCACLHDALLIPAMSTFICQKNIAPVGTRLLIVRMYIYFV